MRILKIRETKKYDVSVSNSSCSCGSGTGSGGYHGPAAKKIKTATAKVYNSQQKQNYRTAA